MHRENRHRQRISWRAYIAAAILVVSGFVLYTAFRAVIRFEQETGITPVTVIRLVFDGGADLHPIDGRVNFLILGIAGGDHDGADLTDTLLALSVRLSDSSLAMISVPRDVWSETLKDKINSAYHYGETKKIGGGLVLAKATVSDVTGLPFQYAVLLDFSGFRSLIDAAGGITIDVHSGFTDTEYPIAGRENDECGGDPQLRCRYETLEFSAGVQNMDGERALKYIRSRHAEGSEGTDFSRGRRQQEVLLALKNKLMSRDVYLNYEKMTALYSAFDKATQTDMKVGELLTAAKLFSGIHGERTKKISLEDMLYAPPSSWYGRYVLIPKDSYTVIHDTIRSELAQ